jgi:hypothetical protein
MPGKILDLVIILIVYRPQVDQPISTPPDTISTPINRFRKIAESAIQANRLAIQNAQNAEGRRSNKTEQYCWELQRWCLNSGDTATWLYHLVFSVAPEATNLSPDHVQSRTSVFASVIDCDSDGVELPPLILSESSSDLQDAQDEPSKRVSFKEGPSPVIVKPAHKKPALITWNEQTEPYFVINRLLSSWTYLAPDQIKASAHSSEEDEKWHQTLAQSLHEYSQIDDIVEKGYPTFRTSHGDSNNNFSEGSQFQRIHNHQDKRLSRHPLYGGKQRHPHHINGKEAHQDGGVSDFTDSQSNGYTRQHARIVPMSRYTANNSPRDRPPHEGTTVSQSDFTAGYAETISSVAASGGRNSNRSGSTNTYSQMLSTTLEKEKELDPWQNTYSDHISSGKSSRHLPPALEQPSAVPPHEIHIPMNPASPYKKYDDRNPISEGDSNSDSDIRSVLSYDITKPPGGNYSASRRRGQTPSIARGKEASQISSEQSSRHRLPALEQPSAVPPHQIHIHMNPASPYKKDNDRNPISEGNSNSGSDTSSILSYDITKPPRGNHSAARRRGQKSGIARGKKASVQVDAISSKLEAIHSALTQNKQEQERKTSSIPREPGNIENKATNSGISTLELCEKIITAMQKGRQDAETETENRDRLARIATEREMAIELAEARLALQLEKRLNTAIEQTQADAAIRLAEEKRQMHEQYARSTQIYEQQIETLLHLGIENVPRISHKSPTLSRFRTYDTERASSTYDSDSTKSNKRAARDGERNRPPAQSEPERFSTTQTSSDNIKSRNSLVLSPVIDVDSAQTNKMLSCLEKCKITTTFEATELSGHPLSTTRKNGLFSGTLFWDSPVSSISSELSRNLKSRGWKPLYIRVSSEFTI